MRERFPLLHLVAAGIGALMLLPLVYLLLRATQGGGALFAEVLGRAETWRIVWRSVTLALGVGTLCVLISLPAAWLTHATDLPGRRAFRILLNLPLAVPSYVSGFVVVAVFGPTGTLRDLLAPLGVERLPEVYGGFGVTLALLYAFPYALLPLQAALGSMDPRTWEAARSLGATPSMAFGRVILPQLRPALAVGFLLVALYVLSDFGAVSLLRYESLSYAGYLRYRSLFERPEAVILGLLLAGLAIGVLLLRRRISGRVRPALTARAGAGQWPLISLGRWRWLALGYCTTLVLFGVVLPVVVVLLWLLRGLAMGNPLLPVLELTWSTLQVSVLAAFITLAAALPPALMTRFGSPRWSRWIWGASHLGYALPGIVVALALVFMSNAWVPSLYQTLALLLFAYTVRFLPLALGSIREGLEAQSPRLYEAARSLGLSPRRAWLRVLLPNLTPAIQAALLIVFLSVVRELPATLLLGPIGFETLATQIWSRTEEALFTAAAPPILILLLLAGTALLARPATTLRRSRVRPRSSAPRSR